MPRTPDAHDGPLYEEEIRFEEQAADPAAEGYMRYVSGAFRLVDASGVYDPRSGGALPSATEVGQFLYSYNGSTFEVVKPLVSDCGFTITDDDGHMVVVE